MTGFESGSQYSRHNRLSETTPYTKCGTRASKSLPMEKDLTTLLSNGIRGVTFKGTFRRLGQEITESTVIIVQMN